MADHQRMLEEIREILQAGETSQTPRERELAEIYSTACQEANQRLRRCDEYLQKGLRSEAIHLANTEPALLDLMSLLDFPEKQQWVELLQFHGMSAPPPLYTEVAGALNEAYADEQPLDELLRKHRRLALVRAPLRSRLAIMRRLAVLDKANPVWQDDIREFEKVRLRDLKEEYREATQRNDTRSLEALARELTQATWVASPPADLMAKVQGSARREQQARALESVRTLETQLNDAISVFDVAKAVALRDQLFGLIDKYGLKLDKALQERLTQARDWVAEQEKRQSDDSSMQKAVRELEIALDREAPRATLDRLYAALRKLDRGMPEDLEKRYRSMGSRRKWASRMSRAFSGGLVMVCVAAIGLGIWYWRQEYSESSKVTTAVQTLKRLLTDEDVPSAREYYDRLDPSVREAPEVVAVEARLQAAEKKEKDRAAIFDQALNDAEATPAGVADGPAFTRAATLARTPDEHARLQRLVRSRREQADKAKAKTQQSQDDALRRRLEALSARVAELGKTVQAPFDAANVAGQVTELQTAVVSLQRDGDEPTRAAAQMLAARLDKIEQALGRTKATDKLLERMSAMLLAENLAGYVEATDKYLKECPDTERGKELKRALDDQGYWQEVLDWNRFLSTTTSKLRLKPTEAKKQAQDWAQYLQAHPKFVETATVRELLKWLEPLPQQDDGDSDSAATRLRRTFAEWYVKDLSTVHTTDGVFYVTEDVRKRLAVDYKNKEMAITYLAGNASSNTVSAAPRKIDAIRDAPQSVIASQVPWKSFTVNWERSTMDLAKRIRDDRDIDPILQYKLLQRVLDYAAKGSYALEQELVGYRAEMARARFDVSVPWINPFNASANKERSQARSFMQKLPSLDGMGTKAVARRSSMEADLEKKKYVVAGWLLRSGDGKTWQVQCVGNRFSGTYELYVVKPRADQPALWQRIGQTVNGKVTVSASDAELVEGRWVFARAAVAP